MVQHQKQRRILVVEDDARILSAIQQKLVLAGFFVASAKTVREALSLLHKSEMFDAIWLDHYLPGEELGFDLVKAVKNNKKCKKIPIFIVSNTGGPEKFDEYMRMGAVAYYVKAEHRLSEIIDDVKKHLDDMAR